MWWQAMMRLLKFQHNGVHGNTNRHTPHIMGQNKAVHFGWRCITNWSTMQHNRYVYIPHSTKRNGLFCVNIGWVEDKEEWETSAKPLIVGGNGTEWCWVQDELWTATRWQWYTGKGPHRTSGTTKRDRSHYSNIHINNIISYKIDPHHHHHYY